MLNLHPFNNSEVYGSQQGTHVLSHLIGRHCGSVCSPDGSLKVIHISIPNSGDGTLNHIDYTYALNTIETEHLPQILSRADVNPKNTIILLPRTLPRRPLFEKVTKAGVTVVVAAGEEECVPASFTLGGDPRFLCVAAFDENLMQICDQCHGPVVDVLAPGSNIYVACPGFSSRYYGFRHGTSFAAANAVVALLRCATEGLSQQSRSSSVSWVGASERSTDSMRKLHAASRNLKIRPQERSRTLLPKDQLHKRFVDTVYKHPEYFPRQFSKGRSLEKEWPHIQRWDG